MMAGNPNWWIMNGMHPQLSSHLLYGAAASNSPNPSPPPHLLPPTQDFPVRSWSQLLLGGIGGGEEEEESSMFQQQQKKVEKYWEQHHQQDLNTSSPFTRVPAAAAHQFQTTWPRQHHPPPPVSSPTSSITTFNFSSSSSSAAAKNQDHSSECNSTSTGGVSKKARVQQSSAQPALKVRKEKLGDRITALHQIVSPFGKTDTASVLSEAIGYIRFLQGQIEALSSPYMRNAAAAAHHQHSVQERNCLFPEEPSQFLNDIAMEGRGVCKQDLQGRAGMKDLRSRGLCLVPISCTQHVGSDTGADYWAPAAFGGGF